MPTPLTPQALKHDFYRETRASTAHATKLRMASRRAFGLLLGTVLVACISPTLPLPPPTAPTISTGSSPDTVKLTSERGAQPNALVVVVNQNEERARARRVAGTLADDNGSYELEIHALPGDRLDLTQETAAVRSPPTTVTVR